MRIESLHINGFGHFHDVDFGPFSSPITIFNGENEAGKSTLLEFIRTIFFGFPRNGRDEFYPPFNGGRHGGHIVAIDEYGSRYTVERYAGARGGVLNITGENGTSYDVSKLNQLLGNSSKVLFQKVFAFGLDELQELNSLDDGDVQGRIYSAGLGVNNLLRSRDQIEQEQKKIYVQGGNFGQSQAVTAVLNELELIDLQTAEHRNDANQYSDLNDELKRLGIELEKLNSDRKELTRQLEHKRKLLNVRDDLVEIGILENKLKEFNGEPKFPENGITRLENIEKQISILETDIKKTNDDLSKLEDIIQKPIEGFQLLEDSQSIKITTSQRALLESAVRDIPERKAEAREQMIQVNDLLSDLGIGWDINKLETIDTSLPIRDRVDQEKELGVKLAQRVAQLQVEKASAEKEYTSAKDELDESTNRLRRLEHLDYDEQTLTGQRRAINTSRQGLLRRGEEQLRLSNLESTRQTRTFVTSPASLLPLSFLFVILGLAGSAWGIIAAGDISVSLIGISLTTFGFILGVLGLKNRTPKPASDEIVEVRQSLSDIENLLFDNSKLLGIDQVDLDTLTLEEEKLSEKTSRLEEQRNLENTLERAKADHKRREQILARSQETLQRALDDQIASRNSWTTWLTEKDFPTHMSANGISELFNKIQTARNHLLNQSKAQSRVSAIEQDILEVYNLVAPLATKHDVNIDPEQSATLIPAIDTLANLLDKAQNNEVSREQQRVSHTQTLERLTSETRRLNQLNSDISGLLALSDSTDSEDFRIIGARHAQYMEYKNDLESHRLTVFRIFGRDSLIENLRTEAVDSSDTSLEQGIEDLDNQLQQTQEARDQLTEEITIARQRLITLSSSKETSSLITQREGLIEELRDLALDWSKYTIALTMLDRAKSRYENERQPKVIQRASEFFQSVTNGRYIGLRATVDETTIMAVTPSGIAKAVNQLSRGTREQMYLALRFGLIQEFSEHTASLPIIFDDALVNSDPLRAKAVVHEFVKLIQQNQVLVFTCHPTFVQQFTDAYPESDIQELHRVVNQ